MLLIAYCWLLSLYPVSYRDKFGKEMRWVFCEARGQLGAAATEKIRFYQREFLGILLGAFRAHFDRVFGLQIPARRFDMQGQFRFPRSTVFLMVVIFAGVLLAIAKAGSVAGGSVWPPLVSVLVFMVLSTCTVAALVWGILHSVRRSGVDRLENLNK